MEHRVEIDEAYRLQERELVNRFVVLDGLPPGLRLPAITRPHGYSEVVQQAVRDALVAEAFRGTIIRYAWQDQHPRSWSKERLRDAARDSLVRYAQRYNLTFKRTHDQWGERWTWNEDQDRWQPSGVYGWSSEAEITGREQR